MGSNKETQKKKKIGTICAAAARLQFIKYNTKHSRVSSKRKRKCWVKPQLAEKHKSLYHGLFSAVLLQGKEEFRMFSRMNTEKYIRLVSLC